MKSILKYLVIIIATILILITSLTIVSAIPNKYIEKNIKESVPYFKENISEIKEVRNKREYSYLHPYADSMILNIIWCTNNQQPLTSILEAKYYKEPNINIDGTFNFVSAVTQGEKEGMQEYIRYWHGSIVILKLLLLFFNIEQIYIVMALVLVALTSILCIMLAKRKQILLIVSIIIGLFMVAIWYVPFCLEYIWTFFIMIIGSMIAIKIESKGDKYLRYLFLIIGICTCFFDFLTTELITILVPIIIVLTVRYKEGRLKNFKQASLFCLVSIILWTLGYIIMFLAKGIITSAVLEINAFDYILNKAKIRFYGDDVFTTIEEMKNGVIYNNFHALYPINIIKNKKHLVALFALLITAYLVFFDIKNIKKMWFPLILIIIAMIPYLRYFILLNHSYKHYFFTFRAQLPSVMATIIVIANTVDKNKMFQEVKKKAL